MKQDPQPQNPPRQDHPVVAGTIVWDENLTPEVAGPSLPPRQSRGYDTHAPEIRSPDMEQFSGEQNPDSFGEWRRGHQRTLRDQLVGGAQGEPMNLDDVLSSGLAVIFGGALKGVANGNPNEHDRLEDHRSGTLRDRDGRPYR